MCGGLAMFLLRSFVATRLPHLHWRAGEIGVDRLLSFFRLNLGPLQYLKARYSLLCKGPR